jgi:peptide/nickel transport system permease protein
MARYLIRRILLAVLTMFAVSVLTFLLFFAVPSDPAVLMCGKQCSPHQLEQTRTRLGLDQPITTQYAEYMKGIFVGRDYGKGDLEIKCSAPCLGYSFHNGEPVSSIVARDLPISVSIVIGAAVVYLLIGVTLGMISALRRGTVFDKVAVGISLAGASMQSYFFGLILLLIFVYSTGLLPNPSYSSPFSDPGGFFVGMLLPWMTLGFLNSAIYARLSRAQMIETLSEDFVRTARAKGLSNRQVNIRHALRAAITPIVTIAGLDLGTNLGGVVITENVFGLNGLGLEAARAVNNLDLPIVMATVLIAAVFIVVMNIVVDIMYTVIDPRVRLS